MLQHEPPQEVVPGELLLPGSGALVHGIPVGQPAVVVLGGAPAVDLVADGGSVALEPAGYLSLAEPFL